MSGFCGWYSPSAVNAELDRMAAPLRRHRPLPLRTARCPVGAVALAAQPICGRLFHDDGLLIAVWGGCAATLARLWRSQGPQGCAQVDGAYAFALVDEYRHEAFLGVDRLASRPLYYQVADGTLLFATSADSIAAHPHGSREPDPQALLDYLYFGYLPAWASALRGQQRLGPGETLHFRQGRAARRRAAPLPAPQPAPAQPRQAGDDCEALQAGELADAVREMAGAIDQPFGKPILVQAHAAAREAARHGHSCMPAALALDSRRHQAEERRLRYERLPAPLRQLVVEPLLFRVLGGVHGGAIARLRRQVADGVACVPSSLYPASLLARYGADTVLAPGLLAACDPAAPARRLREAWCAALGGPQDNRLALVDLEFEVAGGVLPAQLAACELYGLELALPTNDAAQVPVTLAPPLSPAPWFDADARLRALAYDSLLDLRRRQVVRPGFIDMLLSASIEPHAGMVWALMMLELWFAQHAQAPRARQGVGHEQAACVE